MSFFENWIKIICLHERYQKHFITLDDNKNSFYTAYFSLCITVDV